MVYNPSKEEKAKRAAFMAQDVNKLEEDKQRKKQEASIDAALEEAESNRKQALIAELQPEAKEELLEGYKLFREKFYQVEKKPNEEDISELVSLRNHLENVAKKFQLIQDPNDPTSKEVITLNKIDRDIQFLRDKLPNSQKAA